MACKRSAVRSRLAPPAFACFASYGSAGHNPAYRSEASEGCRGVAHLCEDGLVMKYVYILENYDSEHFYVGITDDLRARLSKHNAGEVSHTSKYRPWRLKLMLRLAMKNRPSHLRNI
jgi:hypothetical protein